MNNIKDRIDFFNKENERLEEEIKAKKAEITANNKNVKKLEKLKEQLDELFADDKEKDLSDCDCSCDECHCEVA